MASLRSGSGRARSRLGAGQVGLVGRDQGAGRGEVGRCHGRAPRASRRSELVEVPRRPACPTARGLGGVRPQPAAQLVALGSAARRRPGPSPWRDRRRRAAPGRRPRRGLGGDGPSAETSGTANRGAGVTSATHRAARSRSAAPRACSSLAQGPARASSCACGAPVRGADDEVALGAGGVVLERAEQAADGRRPAWPSRRRRRTRSSSRSSIVQAPRRGPRPARGRRGRGSARPRRAAGAAGRRCRPRTGRCRAAPAARRRARRRAGRPRAARRPARRPRSVPAPATAAPGCRVASSRPQTSVDSRSSSVCPTRPESQVASSRSSRSATAFHSAIESSMSPVKAARVRGLQRGLVEQVELGLALVAPGAERLEVAQRVRGRQRLAQPSRCGGCGGAGRRGDHGVRPVDGGRRSGGRCRARRPARSGSSWPSGRRSASARGRR